jgi:hypothetical protein
VVCSVASSCCYSEPISTLEPTLGSLARVKAVVVAIVALVSTLLTNPCTVMSFKLLVGQVLIWNYSKVDQLSTTNNYTFTPLPVFIVPSIGMVPWKTKSSLPQK